MSLTPFFESRIGTNGALDLVVIEKSLFLQVDGDHFARTQAARADGLQIRFVNEAKLCCEKYSPIVINFVPSGTESVSIE